MTDILVKPTGRRAFLGGLTLGGAAIALPGCAGLPGFSLTDAIQRILFLSSERAFARMLDGGGFWDQQVATLGLENLLGARDGVLASILSSNLFKDRLFDAFGDIAYEGAERAAPLVTEAVRTIGIQNAIDLVNGGPTAATAFLRGSMGSSLIEAMVPELGDAMRLAQDPLVGQAIAALSGVDVPQVASRISRSIDDTIWKEIGIEEAGIRANPRETGDPLIIGVFGTGARL